MKQNNENIPKYIFERGETKIYKNGFPEKKDMSEIEYKLHLAKVQAFLSCFTPHEYPKGFFPLHRIHFGTIKQEADEKSQEPDNDLF